MKLQYIKITKTLYKFFYQEGKHYGEFYIDIVPEEGALAGGRAELFNKDPEYADDLVHAISRELRKK